MNNFGWDAPNPYNDVEWNDDDHYTCEHNGNPTTCERCLADYLGIDEEYPSYCQEAFALIKAVTEAQGYNDLSVESFMKTHTLECEQCAKREST
jgi:hypothetical protein